MAQAQRTVSSKTYRSARAVDGIQGLTHDNYTYVLHGQTIMIANNPNTRGAFSGYYRLMNHWGITTGYLTEEQRNTIIGVT